MAHLGYLNYTRYHVNVSFKGLENLTFGIQEVTFMVRAGSVLGHPIRNAVAADDLLLSSRSAVEDLQPVLLAGGDLVSLRLRGADVRGHGKRGDVEDVSWTRYSAAALVKSVGLSCVCCSACSPTP